MTFENVYKSEDIDKNIFVMVNKIYLIIKSIDIDLLIY